MESDPNSADFIANYQKLATEYSKMRAQLITLKKSVTDEQSKNSELSDELRQKDQKMRKMEQDVLCSNLKSQQLTKRISILETDLGELEALQSQVKSQSVPLTHRDSVSEAGDTDGKTRIEASENISLESQSSECDHELEAKELEAEPQKPMLESATSQNILEQIIEQQNITLNSLRQEKIKLESKLSAAQEELNKVRSLSQNILGKSVNEATEGLTIASSDVNDPLIDQHRRRATDLVDKLYAADSKAMLFHAESNRLKNRLQLMAKDKRISDAELTEVRLEAVQLKDDLSTTVKSYEDQLTTMSDHLATLNEKWMSQQEEIESLRSSANGKFSRKSKKN
ncbi:Protein phosphatase 1 regulatory subunit 21 [Halotydeus destructor]|nr:Protein phosphatase 1 regulatory subunit 21 [Halotydeus destructor]